MKVLYIEKFRKAEKFCCKLYSSCHSVVTLGAHSSSPQHWQPTALGYSDLVDETRKAGDGDLEQVGRYW